MSHILMPNISIHLALFGPGSDSSAISRETELNKKPLELLPTRTSVIRQRDRAPKCPAYGEQSYPFQVLQYLRWIFTR